MKGLPLIVKVALMSFVGAALTLLACNIEMLHYLAVQGQGQLRIIFGARPVSEYLRRDDVSDEKKEKLRLIGELKAYAVSELGLNDNGNYTKIYDQHESPLIWLVIASGEFSLQPYVWKFPVVGEFSYKGYFDRKDAEKLEEKLRAEGYETRIRPASAWSTLGYFKDPVFSSMLEDSEGELADLIFHEMTHGTVFVKNDLQFNENLASFIGEKGALMYLADKYDENSAEYRAYIDGQYDYSLFYDYLITQAKQLDELYNSFSEEMTIEEKREKKEKKITEIIGGILVLPVRKPGRFDHFASFRPNNAYFSAYMTYRADLSALEAGLKEQNGNLRQYIDHIKLKYKKSNVKKAK